MKVNKIILITAFATLLLWGCEDKDPLNNQIVVDGGAKVNTTFIRTDIDQAVRTISANLVMPVGNDLTLVYSDDMSKINTYNQAYYDSAIALPKECYEIEDNKAFIKSGAVRSTDVTINFKNLSGLSRTEAYVLPVTLSSSDGMEVLESSRTTYYVFRGGALINTVADIERNYLTFDWQNEDGMWEITDLTIEALIRPRAFDRPISTIIGMENYFLIRIGDSDRAPSQIQVATVFGKFPAPDPKKNLPINQWLHIALTYNAVNGDYVIYVNGKVQSEGIGPEFGSVDIPWPRFYIGKSYDDNRWFEGDISECRIWNVIRTHKQIEDNPYYVDPESEGLVGYWKFDEGEGSVIKDHSRNGNNAIAKEPLKWNKVSLPQL